MASSSRRSLARAKISETELQIIQLDQDFRSEVLKDLREAQGNIAELIERMVAAEDQLKRIDIRSPRSGIVNSLTVHTLGGVIGNGENNHANSSPRRRGSDCGSQGGTARHRPDRQRGKSCGANRGGKSARHARAQWRVDSRLRRSHTRARMRGRRRSLTISCVPRFRRQSLSGSVNSGAPGCPPRPSSKPIAPAAISPQAPAGPDCPHVPGAVIRLLIGTSRLRGQSLTGAERSTEIQRRRARENSPAAAYHPAAETQHLSILQKISREAHGGGSIPLKLLLPLGATQQSS